MMGPMETYMFKPRNSGNVVLLPKALLTSVALPVWL